MKHSFTLLFVLTLGMTACNSNAGTSADGDAAGQESGQPQKNATTEDGSGGEPAPVEYKFPGLEGKNWRLSEYEYDGRTLEPLKGSKAFIRIEGNKLSGSAGCNNITGEISIREDGTLSIGPLAKTKMLCQGIMTQEERLVELLQGAQSYSVNKIFLEVNSTKGKLSFQN